MAVMNWMSCKCLKDRSLRSYLHDTNSQAAAKALMHCSGRAAACSCMLYFDHRSINAVASNYAWVCIAPGIMPYSTCAQLTQAGAV